MTRLLILAEIVLAIGAAYYSWQAIQGVSKATEYAAFTTACIAVADIFRRRLDKRKSSPIADTEDGENKSDSTPKHWQGILPDDSKYRISSKRSDSIPLTRQTFSFEYNRHGHAAPLVLKRTTVRCEVQFTCQITNVYLAMFAGDGYALNILPPRFLSEARQILEQRSLKDLRENRDLVSGEIIKQLTQIFEARGVKLESVTIGALEKIPDDRKMKENNFA